ncbi:hypothetical protein REPUB_Repub17cG0052300 [Reevesia pubescens]
MESTPNQYFKLNTDGSSIGNPRLARSGGMIRDSGGHFFAAFFEFLDNTSNAIVELQAIRKGIKLPKSLNIHCFIIETDSLCSIQLFCRSQDLHPLQELIIDDCLLLADLVSVSFIERLTM